VKGGGAPHATQADDDGAEALRSHVAECSDRGEEK
jgi:hypothetical protein